MADSRETQLTALAPARKTTGEAAAQPRIAVLVPCYNEAATSGPGGRRFRPRPARSDRLGVRQQLHRRHRRAVAERAGAMVRRTPLRGKGNVVRRMFSDVEADVYLLVDGDDTYDAAAAPMMVRRLLDEGLDMVSAARVSPSGGRLSRRPSVRQRGAQRRGADGVRPPVRDMLTGYRAFSRRFVKSFPAALARLRDRDRAHRPHPADAPAGDRGGGALRRAAGGLGEQALHLPRRLADPAHDQPDGARGAAAAVLRHRQPGSACWPPRC